MIFLIFILVLLVTAAVIIGPIWYNRRRATLQDQKNYERGLKMVPLLIHLPPPSEDNEGTGRDVRDVVDENISKAQIIYNIISSTAQESNKQTRTYGQRHFAFEVVGTKGTVHFYATVPLTMVEVVKQAVVSAYPAARLEEVADHNIFNPMGKLSGTTGGELKLKKEFAYPIATYQDLKRDAMGAILNSLATLGNEDGAAIQILLRPTDDEWRKTAKKIAGDKRKGKEKKKTSEQLLALSKEVATAFVKPPESKDDKKDDKKELSSLEQALVDSIDDKTRYPGYEVLIRVMVSSNISHRAQAILNNIVAAFALFDAPGRNGFKFSAAKDTSELVTSYILRLFPPTEKEMVLNSVELSTIFHFPDQHSIPTSQLERQGSKQVDGPRNMPDDGLLLGYNIFRGVKKPVRLAIQDRQRHMYAVGQTGTGKTTFLENLAFQDMLSGNGFAFVDPHGDVAERLLALVPRERTEDIIYFCPSDVDYPMGLNLFEYQTSDQKDFLIQEVLNMLYKLYDPQHQGIMGPRYEHLFRNAALTIMADPNGGSFVDIPKLFRDPDFVKQKLKHVKDHTVLEFWQKEVPQSQKSNEFGEVVSWFVSKFGAFLSNEMMRNIIGQTKSAFDLRDIMDNNKILLVNLSKGRTGELNSKLLGMIFVMKFQAAAMSRAAIPESERKDFALYVDEFQNFSTDSFATILSEARKYHLNLIVANQFTTQLTDEIREAVFGNVGTIVAFRVGDHDVDSLAKYFAPAFEGSDLLKIPNHNTVVRTLVGGVPTNAFSMSTIPPLGSPNYKLADALKQLSAAKYGRPRAQVEAEIFERLATKVPAQPAPARRRFGATNPFGQQTPNPIAGYGAPAAAPQAGVPYTPQPPYAAGTSRMPTAPTMYQQSPFAPPAAQPAPAPVASNASFLDQWLAKRRPAPGAPYPVISHHAEPLGGIHGAQPTSFSPPDKGRNISSSVAEQAEASYIAKEIKKHGLDTSAKIVPPELAHHKTITPPSESPTVVAPQPKPQKSSVTKPPVIPVTDIASRLDGQMVPPDNPPTHGEVLLRGENQPEDTIFIDQDGNLSHSEGQDEQ